MTTSDLISEALRRFSENLPSTVRAQIRDIARKEMRSLLCNINEIATWRCSWCDEINYRINAGLDHCSKCGAETFTYFIAAKDLRVRYSKNPKRCSRPAQSGRISDPSIGSSTTTYQAPSS